MERGSHLRIHTASLSLASSTRSPRSASSSSHSGSSSSGVSLHAVAGAAASTKRRRSPSQQRNASNEHDEEFGGALSPCCDRDASFEEMSGEELAAAFPSASPMVPRCMQQTAEAPLDSAVAGLRIAASPTGMITSDACDSFDSAKRTEHAPAPKRAGPVGSSSRATAVSSASVATACVGFEEEDCHHQHKKAVTLSRASSASMNSSNSSSSCSSTMPTRPSQSMADFSEEQDCFSICEEIPMPLKVSFQPAIQPQPTQQVVAPAPPIKSSVPLERGLDGRQITSMQRLQERQNIVRVLSCNLEQLCPVGAPLPADPMFLSLFHTSAMPGISIREYMERLSIYTAVTEEAMIQACMHIVRLAHNGRVEAEGRDHARMINRANPAFPPCAVVNGTPHPRINSFSAEPFQVSCFNIHRLLLTALLTTAKYVDDAFHNNRLFSSLGGITLKELNQLEMEFLHLLDYKMTVGVEEFRFMYDQVFNNPARHAEGCCSALHVMGPQIVFEDQPGCDDPFIPCDAQGFAIQGEQEIITFVPQPMAQRAAIAAAAAAAVQQQHQFLQVPASVSVCNASASISASVFEADLDDGMRSTSSSPSASPAQSVRSQATAASITRRMEVMSAEPPMIKEQLVVSGHNNGKGQYVNRSPVSASYSSSSLGGMRNVASHVALQSVTRQGYSPSLSTRDYGRKTMAYKENTTHKGSSAAVTGTAAANKAHAAYLARHGAATLFTPSPMSMLGEGGHHDAFDTNMV